MFSSENTGSPCDEKAEEACRPTFQTPLRMKASSAGFLGKPKAAEDGSQVRDDGPALPSLLLKVMRSETTSGQQTEQPATGNDFVSALSVDSHATDMVVHDENSTEPTVTGLVGVIASMDCEIAGKGNNESITDEGSNSEWTDETDETDSDAEEGWVLDKVASRRNISSFGSVSELIEATQLPEDAYEDAIEDLPNVVQKDSLEGLLADLLECPLKVLPKVSAQSSSHSKDETDRDQILPNQDVECLDPESAKADGDSREYHDHGDFQAEAGQDFVDPEVEGASGSRPLDSIGLENENSVDLEKESSVDARLEDSDTMIEADVNAWIEEARIEAEILIASFQGSFSSNEGNSEVQSDVPEPNHEANLEGSDVTAQQREKIESTEVTFDPNPAGTDLSESLEINITKMDSEEDKHAGIDLTGINSTEENANIDVISSEIINSKETSSPEINTTDDHVAEPTLVETCDPEVVTAAHNFPDAIYGVTQPYSCSTLSNSTTVESSNLDVFELTLPGTQSIVMKSVKTQTEVDNTDSKSASSSSFKSPSSVSSYADTIPGDLCSTDSSEMESAKTELAESISDLDAELELVKNLDNSNFPDPKYVDSSEKATDPPKTEEELFIKNLEDSNFPDSEPVELSDKSSDLQKTEEEVLVKNLEGSKFPDSKPVKSPENPPDSQKREEENRPEDEPSAAFKLLRTLLRCSLGVWMHCWGSPSCS